MSVSPDHLKFMTPDYWDGISISDAETFASAPPAQHVHTTVQEQKAAGAVLASCLDEVMSNQYVEQRFEAGEAFDPTESELGDGAVVIIDSEHLMAWSYPPGRERTWSEPAVPRPAPPAIGTDFVGMWRSRQPYETSTDAHFGDESVTFNEEQIIYSRTLGWGVLLTRRNEARDRLLATWALAAPKATPQGVSVPLSPDSEIFRTAEGVPLEVGKAMPRPDLSLPTFAIRTIERVRGIKIVHAATAEYEPEKEKGRIRSRLSSDLDRVFAPNPEPSTA